MEKNYYDVYNILKELKKLDGDVYSNLLSIYGEDLVNKVIERMIDEDSDNTSKFEYYISRISFVDDTIATSLYGAYSMDMSFIPRLTNEENVKLATEIYYIIKELNDILDLVGYVGDSVWITDRVDNYLGICNDSEVMDKLKRLYDKFKYKRNKLVEGNLRMVISFGKPFYKSGVDINEIIQFGNIGLMRAIEKYDPKYNTLFSTYAYHWIKQSITRNLSDVINLVDVPYYLVCTNMSVNKAIRFLRVEFGREPTVEEIASYLDISVNKVIEVKTLFAERVSLDDYVNSSLSGDEDYTIMDTIKDENSDIEGEVFGKLLAVDILDCLRDFLTYQEFEVICHRFEIGNYSFCTLAQLGEKYGVTKERIRQIENKAKSKIKRKGRGLFSYLR